LAERVFETQAEWTEYLKNPFERGPRRGRGFEPEI
jgi:hypothetical protein